MMGESDNESGGGGREQERLLPIANVSRIMKKALPANAKISKEAKETVQECVSEFISFITGEASDKCQKEKRKTINGDDLLWAMTTLGFEDYVDPLKIYLHKYRELEGDKAAVLAGRPQQGPDHAAHADAFPYGVAMPSSSSPMMTMTMMMMGPHQGHMYASASNGSPSSATPNSR